MSKMLVPNFAPVLWGLGFLKASLAGKDRQRKH